MRYYIRLLVITLLGAAISGCEPYDQLLLGSSSPYYSGGYNTNSSYPYSSYNSRYPSNGYETEYRKAQQQINSANSHAIVNGISQRMLNSGWYPEGVYGNQLIFTRERNSYDQEIYYKTVYTLVPSGAGYKVHANMKLKTVDSPYSGSLDDAAHNVDDRTESILKSVKREVEQQSVSAITPVPTHIPVTHRPDSNPQKKWHYYDQPRSTSSGQTSQPVVNTIPDEPSQTETESEINSSSEQTVDATEIPAVVETNTYDQQTQTQEPFEHYQTKQQNKKERADKAKERKKQSRETKSETHEQEEDHANDQQSTQNENTVTEEPEATQATEELQEAPEEKQVPEEAQP